MVKRINITPEILLALDKLIQEMGSVYKVAQELGVAHSTVLFWKSGKTTHISSKLWQQKLKFLLRPYLTENTSVPSYINESLAEYGVVPQSFNLISLQAMGGFDPNVESVLSYVARNTIGQGFFSNVGGKSVFALFVDKDNFGVLFPFGTLLLVDSGRPACNGEMVLVKFREEKYPKGMIFRVIDDEFMLEPFSTDGSDKCVTWSRGTNSLSFIDWQYPLIESSLKLSSRKW